jgi:hypothetical protein
LTGRTKTEKGSESETGFEVFTALSMKNAVLWEVAPCGFIINQRFMSNVSPPFSGSQQFTEASRPLSQEISVT